MLGSVTIILLLIFLSSSLVTTLGISYLRRSLDPEFYKKLMIEGLSYFRYEVAMTILLLSLSFLLIPIILNLPNAFSWHAIALYLGFLVGHPLSMFYTFRKARKTQSKVFRSERLRKLMKIVLEIAKRRGGVVALSTLINEGVDPKDAYEVLQEFVRIGEAREFETDGIRIWDFPAVRIYLEEIDRLVIESLRKRAHGMTLTELVIETRLNIESLKNVLLRLMREGIVRHDMLSDRYALAAFSE